MNLEWCQFDVIDMRRHVYPKEDRFWNSHILFYNFKFSAECDCKTPTHRVRNHRYANWKWRNTTERKSTNEETNAGKQKKRIGHRTEHSIIIVSMFRIYDCKDTETLQKQFVEYASHRATVRQPDNSVYHWLHESRAISLHHVFRLRPKFRTKSRERVHGNAIRVFLCTRLMCSYVEIPYVCDKWNADSGMSKWLIFMMNIYYIVWGVCVCVGVGVWGEGGCVGMWSVGACVRRCRCDCIGVRVCRIYVCVKIFVKYHQ